MSSNLRPSLYHGSHPSHPFRVLEYNSRRPHCSICSALGSEGMWYTCCETSCNYVLCPKCFDIEERLFSSVQVVIRNPLIPYDSADAMVYTRPRPTSFKLSPLYAGKLMEVVSSAECREIPSLMFFRLRTGGWINASHVVCVVPAEGLIQDLALIHLTAAREMQIQQHTSLQGRYANLRSYIEESLRLIDDNPPYGIVMSALTVYPVLVTVAAPPPSLTQQSRLSQSSAAHDGGGADCHGNNEEENSSMTSALADNEEAVAAVVKGCTGVSHHGAYDVPRRVECHGNKFRSASNNHSSNPNSNTSNHHHHHRSLYSQSCGYAASARSRSNRSYQADCRVSNECSRSSGKRSSEGSTYHTNDDDNHAVAIREDVANEEEDKGTTRDEGAASMPVTSEDIANDIIRFAYFTLHTVLYELECSLDENIPIADGTMLSLHVEIFAGCLLAAHDLSQQWQITLPEPFVPLVLRLLTMLGRISVLLHCIHPAVDAVRLREPAVVSRHVDIASERIRIRQLCRTMTDVAARLLLNGLACKYAYTLRDLQPIREQLTYVPNEVLEKVFCELVSAATAKSAALLADNSGVRGVHDLPTTVATRRGMMLIGPCRSLDTDPLEIVVRLARSATLAESQIAAFRVVATIARHSPDDISRMATIVLPPLFQMAAIPRSPAVITASLECFFEMAYPVGMSQPADACEHAKSHMNNNSRNCHGIATNTAITADSGHTYADPMSQDATQLVHSIAHSTKAAPKNSTTTACLTQAHRASHLPLVPLSFYPHLNSIHVADSAAQPHLPCALSSLAHSLQKEAAATASGFDAGHALSGPSKVSCFSLASGMLIGICQACAARHPPSGASLESMPPLPLLQCQCTICGSKCAQSSSGSGSYARSTPHSPSSGFDPKMHETTSVGRSTHKMLTEGLPSFLIDCINAHSDIPAIMNAVGRLMLRVELTDKVTVHVVQALCEKTMLAAYAEAVLAVASRAHVTVVREALRECAHSELARFVAEPYCSQTPLKRMIDETPASNGSSIVRCSMPGLSPSPFGDSAHRSSVNTDTYSSMRGFTPSSELHPIVGLFSKNY